MTSKTQDLTHPVLRFVQRADKLTSAEDILPEFLDVLSPYKIDYLIYVTVNQDDNDRAIWSNINIHENPHSDRFFDPFLKYCCTTFAPTYTGVEFLDDYPYLLPDEKAFIENAATMGFRSGIALPVSLADKTRYGGFNLGTGFDKQDFLRSIAPIADKLMLACVLLNQRLESLRANKAGSDITLITGSKTSEIRKLTKRERDILFLLSQGHSRKKISNLTGLTLSTVGSYVRDIYSKLGVNNRSDATRLAIKMGLKPPRFETPPPSP